MGHSVQTPRSLRDESTPEWTGPGGLQQAASAAQTPSAAQAPRPRLIRSASLAGFRDIVRGAGFDAHRLLREAGLPADSLSNPDLRVPAMKVAILLETTAVLPGLGDLGLRMARTRNMSNWGPIALAIRDEPTLRDALQAVMRFGHMHNEALLLRVDEEQGLAIVREHIAADQPIALRQSSELVIGAVFRMLQLLLGPGWQPRAVCFSHAAPHERGPHERMFGSQVRFNQDFSGIVCAASDLDLALPAADPIMAGYARQYLEQFDTRRQQPMSEDVRRLVILLLPSGRATLENIARHLGVHRRTVLRHLSAEQQTFAGIVNEVRRGLAVRHLDRRERPLGEIAALLGFGDLSAFSRWFKTSFGCSASRFARDGRR
jgi:AraC-like DNA-binding protein